MNMKALKNLPTGLVAIITTVFIIIISISNFVKSSYRTDPSNNKTVNNSQEGIAAMSIPTNSPNSDISSVIPSHYIKKIGEAVRQVNFQSDFTITVNSVRKMKELDEMDLSMDDLDIPPSRLDDNGELKSNYNYVFLDITLENNLSEQITWYVSYFIIKQVDFI